MGKEEELQIDRETGTSFESRSHNWGVTSRDPQRERALYYETLATVERRKNLERERVDTECQLGKTWALESEKQIAWQWHVKREEGKQEKDRLSVMWRTAAEERQREKQVEKAVILQEEKEMVQKSLQGM